MDLKEFNRINGTIAMADKSLAQNLLASTAFTPAARDPGRPRDYGAGSFDQMIGAGAEGHFNTRAALAAKARKKKKSNAFMPMQDLLGKNSDVLDGGDIYPWSRRMRRMKGIRRVRRMRGDLDGKARKGGADADGKTKRTVTDSDGKKIVVDKDGRIATDADGKKITIGDGENGHRIADAGDGTRVIVDPKGRVLNGPDKKPIIVDDSGKHKMTIDPDGTRAAISDDGLDRIVMQPETPKVKATPDEMKKINKFMETDSRAVAATRALDTIDQKPGIMNRISGDKGDIKIATKNINDLTAARDARLREAKNPATYLLDGPIARQKPEVGKAINEAVQSGDYKQAARIAEKSGIGEWAFWNKTRRQFSADEIKQWNKGVDDLSNFARNRGDDGYKKVNKRLKTAQKALDKAKIVESKITVERLQTVIKKKIPQDIFAKTKGIERAPIKKTPYADLLESYATKGGTVPSRAQIQMDLERLGVPPTEISRGALAKELVDTQIDHLYKTSPDIKPRVPGEAPDVSRSATPAKNIDIAQAQSSAATPKKINSDFSNVSAKKPTDIIETQDSTPRTASDPDIKQRTPDLDAKLRTVPGADLETVKAQNTPDKLKSNFGDVNGADIKTNKMNSFLAESGDSLDAFKTRIKASIDGPPNVPRGADIDIPTRGINTGQIRKSRAIRMLIPGYFDVALMTVIAGGVTLYAGQEAAAMEKITGGSDMDALGAAITAGGKNGAETLPVAGTTIAFNDGRNAEGTVRAIEDVVEFASPFAFAAMGAGGGAVAGGGVLSIPGAILGGLGGLAVGVAVSLGVSEATRSIARGLGYDDVDRGMIGSMFAPEYADAMEGWVKEVAADGKGFRDGESLSDVMERINEDADTDHEKIENFRDLLGVMRTGILHKQKKQVEAVSDRIIRDNVGIEGDSKDVLAALRLPEAREKITGFYKRQAQKNPDDPEISEILDVLEDFGKSETERVKLAYAHAGADIMDAREMSEKLEQELSFRSSGGLGFYAIEESTFSPSYRGEEVSIRNDLESESVNYSGRLKDIREHIEAADDVNVKETIGNSFKHGTTIYEEMGTVALLAESYNLVLDVEEALAKGQLEIVNKNWGQIQKHMQWDSADTADWNEIFTSDTTLGAQLKSAMKSAKANDPAAQELKELLEKTGNLKNTTPELARQLLNNEMFRKQFDEIVDDADDDALKDTLDESGFDRRTDLINDARKQINALEARAEIYGFKIGLDTQAEQKLTPRAARDLTTETEPEPAPQL